MNPDFGLPITLIYVGRELKVPTGLVWSTLNGGVGIWVSLCRKNANCPVSLQRSFQTVWFSMNRWMSAFATVPNQIRWHLQPCQRENLRQRGQSTAASQRQEAETRRSLGLVQYLPDTTAGHNRSRSQIVSTWSHIYRAQLPSQLVTQNESKLLFGSHLISEARIVTHLAKMTSFPDL